MAPIISAASAAEAADKAVQIALGIPEAEPWGSHWLKGRPSGDWQRTDIVVEGVIEHHPPSLAHDPGSQKAFVVAAAARAAA